MDAISSALTESLLARVYKHAAYTAAFSPANVFQGISTPPSELTAADDRIGIVGSRKETQSAHRQSVFQCSIPVALFNLISWSLPC